MSISDIFCQDKAVSILQRAFASGRLAHAYIFAGIEGTGKFTTAKAVAKLLVCRNPSGENGFADSCGECESCRLFEAGSHPDFNNVYKELVEFTRDGKGKKTPVDLPIDVVREFLIEKASTRPTLSERKVFIVNEAERLNIHSQNALLKVLEEPPEYCFLILVCTRLEKLLPTIKSRCQIIRFLPVSEDKITEKLKQMDIEETAGRYFARLCQGSLGLACQWAKLELADAQLYKAKKDLIEQIADYKYSDSLELANQFIEQSKRIANIWADLDKTKSKTDINRRAQKTFVQIIVSALQDAMKINLPAAEMINCDQLKQIKKLAQRFNPEQSTEKISDCYQSLRWIDASVNEKLIFEQLLLNLAVSDKMKMTHDGNQSTENAGKNGD